MRSRTPFLLCLPLWTTGCHADSRTAPRQSHPMVKASVDTSPPPKAPIDRYATEVARLKRALPGFTVTVVEPFVVVGDEAPATVRRRGAATVRWAVEKLKQDHFTRDPEHVLTVYLFKDALSYRTHAKALFGEEPDTPYGYYSPADRALVMNIATGGGTLVHEIVHPFMDANFPACPAWFNEGLGSLYEQSAERDGRIVGLTNWRLVGLQRRIRAGSLRSLKKLLNTSSNEFYEDDDGSHYAAARYLLYYLQEQGKLHRFHRDFRAASATDPTGEQTLKTALGLRTDADLAAFQQRWERWVLGLSFKG